VLERVLGGEFSGTGTGTGPEMESLARRLRGAGVEVVVSGQAANRCSGQRVVSQTPRPGVRGTCRG